MNEVRELHAAADKVEARLVRAVLKSLVKLRALVEINELAIALADRDVEEALSVLTREEVADSLQPAAAIIRDTVLRGGKFEARQLNKA